MIEADHHGRCCSEKPANVRRRRTRPQLVPRVRSIMPDDEDLLDEPPPVPRATRGRMIDGGLISDDDNSSTEPHQYEPPVPSQGNSATVGDEPMVTWAKYGLTAPLALWPPAPRQKTVQPQSALTFSAQAGMPHGNPKSAAEYIAYAASASAQPKSAQSKYSHWQAVANILKN